MKIPHYLQQEALHLFPEIFQTRPENSHKGTFGTAAIVGSSCGMSGAIILSGTAALYSACGRVWLGFCQNQLPMPYIAERAEIMLNTASDLLQHTDIQAWAIGPGMGKSNPSIAILCQALQQKTQSPLLLDADALNILAIHSHAAHLCKQAAQHRPIIFTPHSAEAARLSNTSTEYINAHREKSVLQLAKQWHTIVVLKGKNTLIATPDGTLNINKTGNAALACAGSGDVLTGIIVSLLAQGFSPYLAACSGVWLHGAAADTLVHNGIGPHGLLAGEITPIVRLLRNTFTRQNKYKTNQT